MDLRRDQRILVDVAIPALTESQTLVLTPGWWRGDFQQGSGIAFVPGRLASIDGTDDIVFTSEHYALVPIEAWEPEKVLADHARAQADYDRGLYIQGLRFLAGLMPEYRIAPYLRYILDRPRPDFEKIAREKIAGLREVGAVVMYDGQSRKVDALVIDERGNAAVVDDDGWLAPYMAQWHEDQRSDVTNFIKWVSERSPYGDMTLGTSFSGTREGTVEDIAVELIRG